MARCAPDASCELVLEPHQWQALYAVSERALVGERALVSEGTLVSERTLVHESNPHTSYTCN